MVLIGRDGCCFVLAVFHLLSAAVPAAASDSTDPRGRRVVDVAAGGNVTLHCVLDPGRLQRGSQLQWHRVRSSSNSSSQPIVAIAGVYTADFYSVEYDRERGVLNLLITDADYNKHNADYDCYLMGANDVQHIDNASLNVLYPPSAPSIYLPTANDQTLIEGAAVVINCSSVGGSPSPRITWFQQLAQGGGVEKELNNMSLVPAVNRSLPTVSQLYFTPSRADNGAQLRCAVWNRFLADGESLDTVVTLSVNYYPRVTIQPPSLLRVREGGSVRLSCGVDARPAVSTVRWTFIRDSPLSEATTPVSSPHSTDTQLDDTASLVGTRPEYSVSSVQITDAGVYTCTARNGVGTGSGSVRVQVMYAPRVTLDPSVVDVDVGDLVVVKCRVDAQPQADRVYWQRVDDGGAVSSSAYASKSSYSPTSAADSGGFYMEGSVLRLVNVQGANAGQYMCVAVNALPGDNGEVVVHKSHAIVTVNVKHSPGTARVQQLVRTAVMGQQLTLSCIADPPGYPEPTYRWWRRSGTSSHNSRDRTSAATLRVDEESLAVTSANWSVSRLQEHHAGQYWCRAENALGSGPVSPHHTVIVHRAPRLDMTMQPRVVREAGPATLNFHLSCSATARPAPSVIWLKNGRPILSTPAHTASDDSDIYRVESKTQLELAGVALVRSSLNFVGVGREGDRELRPDDIGRYTCRFSNIAGSVNSSTALLVKHSPVMRHTQSRVGANLAGTARIQCRVQAYPAPEFRWTFGGRVLITSGRVMVESGRDNATNSVGLYGDLQLANVYYMSTLILRNVGSADYGEYACLVSNGLGQTSARLQLQPKSGPSPPRQLKPVIVAGSWVQLVWIPGFDGGYRNTEYRVSLLDDRQREMDRDCGVTLPCNITQLEPQTTYRLRIVAQNNGGRSKPSEQIQFTTLTDPSAISLQYCKLLIDHSVAQMALVAPADTEGLVAIFDVSDLAASLWRLAAFSVPVPISGHTVVSVPEEYSTDLYNMSVRVRLCSLGDLSVCSEPVIAKTVAAGSLDYYTASILSSGSSRDVVFASVGGALGVLVLLMISACCWLRFRRRRQLVSSGSSAKLSDPTNVTKLPPYYPPGVLEKQAVSPGIPSTAADKSVYAAGNGAFEYGQTTGSAGDCRQMAAPMYAAATENSSGGVDSQNGGSLNSQHSLWHVARGATVNTVDLYTGCDNDPTGGNGALYHTENQQQQHSMEYPAYVSYNAGAQHLPPVYQHQYQPADYTTDSHQLAPVSYSAYPADVNGMDNFPDAVHVLGVPVPPPSAHVPPASPRGVAPAPSAVPPVVGTLGFDESMESGFSTPNQSSSRRVIREIVV